MNSGNVNIIFFNSMNIDKGRFILQTQGAGGQIPGTGRRLSD